MKKEKYQDYDKNSLQEELLKCKKEYFNLRFQKKMGELTDLSKIRKVKRNIARIFTFVNKKKI
jgi:large subunit ribosomal protein L29